MENQIVALVKQQIKSGIMPTPENLAIAIKADRYLLFNFLMDNNLPSVNEILKLNLGEPMAFYPQRKQVEGVIDAYIKKGEDKKLQMVINNFRYNPQARNYTTEPAYGKAIVNFMKS